MTRQRRRQIALLKTGRCSICGCGMVAGKTRCRNCRMAHNKRETERHREIRKLLAQAKAKGKA